MERRFLKKKRSKSLDRIHEFISRGIFLDLGFDFEKKSWREKQLKNRLKADARANEMNERAKKEEAGWGGKIHKIGTIENHGELKLRESIYSAEYK